MFKLYLILFTTLFSVETYAGPFSDFKAGAELSEELSSSPTGFKKRNTN